MAPPRIGRVIAWAITVGALVFTVASFVAPGLAATWLAPFATPAEARELVARAGPLAWLIYLALWIVQAVAAPIPAFALALAGAALFGFWAAILLTTSGAIAGAIVTYWLGQNLRLRPPGTSRAERLIETWGAWAVLALRLVPLFPFDPVSYAAGYFRVPAQRFALATVAGMLPATIVLTLIGSGKVQQAMYWPIFLAAAAVWALAILGGWMYVRRRSRDPDSG